MNPRNMVNGLVDPLKPVMEVVRDLAAEPGREDAFFVFEADEVIRKVQLWRRLLPRAQLFYAVKCNNYRPLLELLAGLGTGFDCSSRGEIEEVLALGVDPSRIIYAHPCKPTSHLRYALEVNLPLMTFDNVAELHKVKTYYPGAQLVLRIRCDAAIANVVLGEKFGVEVKDARLLLATARALGLTVVGVSFHVGSGCGEPFAFHRAIAAARKVFDEAEDEGFKLHLLDVGGGFPGYDDDMMVENARVINTALDLFFPDDGRVKVISEPGRYVAESAFTLATSIMGRRDVLDGRGRLTSVMYYTNDSVYASFNEVLSGQETPLPRALKASDSEVMVDSTVWGQTCCSFDRLSPLVQLPLLSCGGWLVWPNKGSYSLVLFSSFNGFKIPEVHMISPRKASEPAGTLLNPRQSSSTTYEGDVSAMELKRSSTSDKSQAMSP